MKKTLLFLLVIFVSAMQHASEKGLSVELVESINQTIFLLSNNIKKEKGRLAKCKREVEQQIFFNKEKVHRLLIEKFELVTISKKDILAVNAWHAGSDMFALFLQILPLAFTLNDEIYNKELDHCAQEDLRLGIAMDQFEKFEKSFCRNLCLLETLKDKFQERKVLIDDNDL